MIAKYGKRALSFILALIMILSVMPTQALAEENHDHDHENESSVNSAPIKNPTNPGESIALVTLRADIAAYIEKLGITPNMTDTMLLYAYGNHESYEAAQASLTIQDAFMERAMQLSKEEQQILYAEENTQLGLRYREVVEKAYGVQLLAGGSGKVEGVEFSATTGTLKVSGTTVTATVKGSGSDCDGYKSSEMTIYITNTSGAAGAVSFDMAMTNVHSIYVGDKDGKSTGESLAGLTKYTKGLAVSEVFTIIIKTDANTIENKLVMSNVTFVGATTGFTVTVEYPNAYGSVTSSVEGTSVEADGITTITIPDINAAEGVTLTATSNSFLCWVDQNNKIVSRAMSFTINPSADTTVKAIMTGGNAHFLVNGNLVYGDLNTAANMAKNADNKTVVLMNDGTLPAGDYTIPSGVTLLIPFDEGNTLYTSEPESVASKANPTTYRTLTMASGANITINGALSLSAKHSHSQLANGRPVDVVSFIDMQSNSKITVNKGGNLYAWGYITGDGAVEVKSGATVYEYFQVMDWRGGTAGTGMIGNKNRVFLMSQYYIQNIEVPMTIHAGASEKCYMSVDLPVVGPKGSNVPFIGTSNCMFTISDGYIIKDYREGTGRLDIDVYGDVSVSTISISLSAYTVKSADYELPINGNLTIDVYSGNINLNQNVAFQPGSELYIREGAVCNLGSANSIYVYAQDDWGPYVYNDGSEYKSLPYVPGGNGIEGRGKDALIQIDGTAILNGTAYATTAASNIVSNGNGVIVIGKIGTQTVTYQAKQNNTSISYDSIDITPFKLKNADGTYVDTGVTTGTYTYTDGVWVKTECNHQFDEVITKAPTCTETGLKTQTCKDTVNCGLVNENVEVPATGHTAGADATCTTAQTCSVCGAQLKDALGHTEVVDAAKAPTCTETGLTEGKHCSVCNTVTVAQEEVPALGHTEVVDAAKAPTCTETGLTEGKHCSVCNTVTVAQEEVPALGHTAGAEATCTDAQTCTVCGAELVAALGHDEVAHEAKDPTCTEIGWDAYETCSRCDYTTYVEKAALGHDEVAHEAKDPTCTEIGWDAYETCSRCDYTTYVEKAALGHDEVEHEAKNPTCTEIGWDAYVTCSRCDYTTYVEKAALDHSYVPSVTGPTCTEDGYTTHICSRCNDSYTDSIVPALGHNWEWITDQEATVLNPGVKHEECSVCHEKRNENTEIPVLKCAHTGTITGTAAKAATCTEDGNSAYWYCSACQNYYSDAAGQHEIAKDSWIIAALGHDEVEHEAKAPTCTEIGWDAYETCSRCDYTTYEEKAALGHDEVAHEAKDPTCTEIGWDAYETCSRCDYTTYVEKAALGHDEVAHEAKDPTCTEIGWDAYVTCSRCDYTTYEEKTALGHDEVAHEAKDPACTEIGWDAYVTCSRCDYTTYVEIPAVGHSVMERVSAVAATCQKEGTVAYYHCDACGKNYADVDGKVELETIKTPIDPDNHDWADEGEVTAATCKAEGKIVYACENDGCTETKTEILPVDPEGHVWDEGEPYKIHSCNSASYMIYTCTLCKTKNQVVVREQHFRVPIGEEIPATCTTDGMTSGWKCEKCDEFWIPQEVIPALGHDWNGNFPCQSETSACTRCDVHFDTKQEHLVVIDPAVAATCTATGLTEGSHCGYCGEVLVAQTEIPMAEHNWIIDELETPATCNSVGHKAGAKYCVDCDYDEDPIPMLEHEWVHRDAKKATYSAIGWNAHDYCLLCNATKTLEQYENHPCEFCGENPEGYIEIPMVEIQKILTLDEYLSNIGYLEMMAAEYAKTNPNADPLGLVLNYLRTAVANYTTGSWAIMAGPEDKDFLKFVQDMEDTINSNPDIDVWVNVSGLKKIKSYKSPIGEKNLYNNNSLYIISGHFYGTMDMTYHNKGSQNHADVGGWVGDLTDLLSTTDEYGVPANLTLEEKIAYITKNYLFKENVAGAAGSFGSVDLYADLDAFYMMNELITKGYNTGDLAKLLGEYYNSELTLNKRFEYLLNNRLDGLSIRQDLRTAVYNAYTSNKLIATLEGTRNFKASGNELAELRKAICYAFADEMCRLAGDYVEDLSNPRFTVFDTETKILAPGVTQQISYATNADGKQIVFYVATADVKRDDVGLWVNYYDRDPGTPENPVWKNNSVPSSAQNAQDRYGDPNSPDYIENFNVIASTNAGGYSMQDDATPGGLMVMNGVEWFPQTNTAGFFAILSDGTAYMGTYDEYRSMMDAGLIQEAIGGFGEFVVMDGKVTGSATYSDAPRTSVGITSTGRVVIMCIDGRQAPFSSGASLQDVGYIMKEAGCVVAINLDGGGSTTFVARQPGDDELTIMNRPSDGYPRNVSTNLLIYSTAPSSTAFDHAVIESEYDYATINTPVQMSAAGVSPAGNAVDIPEGAIWAVSNEDWASITEDGVFTGKRLGEVYVYLMLDGVEIGSKLMTLTNPDQVYFEKNKVDAIYGSSVTLPLRARVGGKPIAINPGDVTFTLSAPKAGSMDGFNFVAVESGLKTLTITAAISDNAQASINVMLYKQGENSFDFDKATGGDRNLAWDRQVSNSKVEDGNIYNVIDPSKDMVVSYTFALDMTTIPIPERLEELTYMLPGGTLEGATAWSFLLSLAQRISDMSWVKATIDFDDRFDVDYSELKILNEYFNLKGVEFDETTNTLSVTMNWIKQSQVIDEATANPLCLINGIKLTPKDSAWTDVTKIDAVTSGTIGYEIYMRASGLYGFAQKPENQAIFGIYPYRNPNDTTDAGGYFRDTYAEITDTFTLVNVVKEGWVNEDGGFAYYVEGEKLTGVQQIDGFYYDFGENGVNVGQTKLTGLFFDEEAQVYRYSYIGELADGWQSIGGEWYYFKNYAAVSGPTKVGQLNYEFEENGKLISGVWVNTLNGYRYYYGPAYYSNSWREIDGNWYYFRNGCRVTGIKFVPRQENKAISEWRLFDENGVDCGLAPDGMYILDGVEYYLVSGQKSYGLRKVGEDYYLFKNDGIVKNKRTYAWVSHCDLPVADYDFGADGKLLNGIVEKVDGMYFYENGNLATCGLVEYGGTYYYVYWGGIVKTGKQYVVRTRCDLPAMQSYEFGEDGKILNGVVEKEDGLYFYENGNLATCGMVNWEGNYYYVYWEGVIKTGKQYVVRTRCDLPAMQNYEFGADGKMLNGVVEKENGLYFYENGNLATCGMVNWEGNYYYVYWEGVIKTGKQYVVRTRCDLPASKHYEFGADGKMTSGIVEKDGVMYFYENGAPATCGLIEWNGDYYYTDWDGIVQTGKKYVSRTRCDLPVGNYEFGSDGKMLEGIVEKDGVMYFYENGAPATCGLINWEGDYYYVYWEGVIKTGKQHVVRTRCDLPVGTYEFSEDGKMLDGFIVRDGVKYYYVNGVPGTRGLTLIDGDYYYIYWEGIVKTGKQYTIATNCDLPISTYEFDEEGRMLNGFYSGSDGSIYYYINGKKAVSGLYYVDGYYYFVVSAGKLITNQTDYYVWKGNGLLFETYYDFNELGQIIG